MKLFSLFSSPSVPTVEKWANHNAKKATPDDLIAGAIVASFAKDFKCWKFEGEFQQKHNYHSDFRSTSLSRKVPTKKHVEIRFVFKKITTSDGSGTTTYIYNPIGCEVNGVRMSEAAYKYIYFHWNNVVVQVKRAEEVANQAKADMEANETKWNLAESLLGMKRDGFGTLQPVKTAETDDA